MPLKDVTRARQTSARAVANNLANGISMPAVYSPLRIECSNIQTGPIQERHLSPDPWHVVKQKKGMVRLTTQMKYAEHPAESVVQKIESGKKAEKEKKSFGPGEIELAIRQALFKVKLDLAELAQVIKVIEEIEKVSLDAFKIDRRLPIRLVSERKPGKSENDVPVQKVDAQPPGMPLFHILSGLGIPTGLALSAMAVNFIYLVYQILEGDFYGALAGVPPMAFILWLMSKL